MHGMIAMLLLLLTAQQVLFGLLWCLESKGLAS
jgi:hypothetical protein